MIEFTKDLAFCSKSVERFMTVSYARGDLDAELRLPTRIEMTSARQDPHLHL